MSELLVSMEGIEKTFPGVHALSQCKLEIYAGEVHALMGENGAGKSTLMKCLTGVYQKDSGTIKVKGKEVEIENPRAAQELGIAIIHQELNLCQHLTIAQNIFIGNEKHKKVKGWLNDTAMNEGAREILESMNLDLDPTMVVKDLTVAKQQMVEIAKALSYNSEVLIMDEPSAALTQQEIQDMFKIIRHLQSKGVGIVYISHRMDEIKEISNRVTVMRDGEYVGTRMTEEVTIDDIIKMMVGRSVYVESKSESQCKSNEVVLEVKNLNRGKVIKDVSFKLKKGEILGFSGLMGAGRTEVARAIFGADKFDSGEIYVKGKKVEIKTPADSVGNGIGYLSEDRKRYGLNLSLDLETNVVMASYSKYLKGIFVLDKTLGEDSKGFAEKLRVKTPSMKQKAKFLSGGNQQKVVIAKWLMRDCDVLIFDEPTRGIDVGAKSEIYDLLQELVNQGKSIIMISSELTEVLRMSDRVIVMCEGRITGELDIAEANQENIMKYATKRETMV